MSKLTKENGQKAYSRLDFHPSVTFFERPNRLKISNFQQFSSRVLSVGNVRKNQFFSFKS